jgi:hypothetical protein
MSLEPTLLEDGPLAPPIEERLSIEERWRRLQAEKRAAALAGRPAGELASNHVPKTVRRARPLDNPDLESIPDDPAIARVRAEVEAEAQRRRDPEYRRQRQQARIDSLKASHARRRDATVERVRIAAEDLAPDGGPLSTSDLARRAGVSVATAYKVRKQLVAEGKWRWDQGYRLGPWRPPEPEPEPEANQPAGDRRPPGTVTEGKTQQIDAQTDEDPSMGTATATTGSTRDRVLAAARKRLAAGQVVQPNEMAVELGMPPHQVSNHLWLLRKAGELPAAVKGQPGHRAQGTPARKEKPEKPAPHVNGSASAPASRPATLRDRTGAGRDKAPEPSGSEPDPEPSLSDLAAELEAAARIVRLLGECGLDATAALRVVSHVHGLLEEA